MNELPITIWNAEEADQAMLIAILTRVVTNWSAAKEIIITVTSPERDGTLHYHMRVDYQSGGGITLGCLKRAGATEVEFHS